MIKKRPSFPKGKAFLSSGFVDIVQYYSDGCEIYQLKNPPRKNLFGVVIHCETDTDADKKCERYLEWWGLLQNISLLEKSKVPFRDHVIFLASIQVNENFQPITNTEKILLNQNQSVSLLKNVIKSCKIAEENNFIPIIDDGSFVLAFFSDSFAIFPFVIVDNLNEGNHEFLCTSKSIVKVIYQFATGIKIEGNLSELKNRDISPAHRWNRDINENFSDFLKSELIKKKNIDSSIETLENNLNKILLGQKSGLMPTPSQPIQADPDSPFPSTSQGLGRIAGMKKLKELLFEEIIQPIQNPEPYKLYQINIPHGILLYGPPGCGKTFIARQLAEELSYYFLEISPSDIASPFIHDSVLKIQSIFVDAEHHAPSIIFIDEFDAFVPSRSSLGGHQQFKSEEVNEFLHHLNECSDKGIIIIAATNEPEKIDNAILRTGRFDKLIYVEAPDLEARKDLLKMYLKNRPQDPISFEEIAVSLVGCSCSDVKNIIDESARLAMKENVPINNNHIKASILKNPSSLPIEINSKYNSLQQRGIERTGKNENGLINTSLNEDDTRYFR